MPPKRTIYSGTPPGRKIVGFDDVDTIPDFSGASNEDLTAALTSGREFGDSESYSEDYEDQGSSRVMDILGSVGLTEARLADVEDALDRARDYVDEQFKRARGYARDNPGIVLGGLASVVLGAGLLTARLRSRETEGRPRSKSSGSRSGSKSSKKSGSSSGSSRKASSGASSSTGSPSKGRSSKGSSSRGGSKRSGTSASGSGTSSTKSPSKRSSGRAAKAGGSRKSGAAKKRSTSGSGSKRTSGKRELIKPRGSARFIKRDSQGQIKESVDVGRSLRADRSSKSKTKVASGYGDRGDRPRA